jgi:3-phosphoshikimate 1-carboxyvinyltransferase
VKVRSLEREGYPPIEITGGKLSGGEISVSGKESSQHISSLLMVAPYAETPVTIKLIDRLHSSPYVDITIDAMRQFGVEVENHYYKKLVVKSGQRYSGKYYRVEGDYSSAAYFFATAAIGKGFIVVSNLEANSVQGDRYFLEILSRMGCQVNYDGGQVRVSRRDELTGITIDMGDCPDIVQPLAVVAAYAKGKTKISNVAHLRLKESDRIGDTATELRKMGIEVEVTGDEMSITGGSPGGATIDSHNDHRMTMSFAIAALFADGDTIINGAESVAKSYPGFFEDLISLGAKVEEI